MKRTLVLVLALVALVIGSAAGFASGNAPRLFVDIPFEFYASGQLMPAGQYIFEMPVIGHTATGAYIGLRSQDGSLFYFLNSMPGATVKTPAYCVVFNKYGRKHFLSSVLNGDYRASLPRSRTERELLLAASKGSGDKASPVAIAAVNR